MQVTGKSRRKPSIVIGETDHERLTNLATSAAERMPEVSEELLSELDRARVVADDSLPEDVIRIGSTVGYRTNSGEQRTVTLVYPGEADISEGKVSILTPIGTALIGLKTGQSMSWMAHDGRWHELTIVPAVPVVSVVAALSVVPAMSVVVATPAVSEELAVSVVSVVVDAPAVAVVSVLAEVPSVLLACVAVGRRAR